MDESDVYRVRPVRQLQVSQDFASADSAMVAMTRLDYVILIIQVSQNFASADSGMVALNEINVET